MMRPSVQGVDPPVCCTPGCYCYICKRQLCGFTGWALCLLEGGSRYPGCYCYICKRQFLWIHRLISWHQSYKSIKRTWVMQQEDNPKHNKVNPKQRMVKENQSLCFEMAESKSGP